MGGKRYFVAKGQQDAYMNRRLTVRHMRDWPQWAFDAYAWAWVTQVAGLRPAGLHLQHEPGKSE